MKKPNNNYDEDTFGFSDWVVVFFFLLPWIVGVGTIVAWIEKLFE